MDLEKEIKREEKKIEKSLRKVNVWMIISIVLAIALLAVLVWPHSISKTAAGQKIVDFASSQGVEATVASISSKGAFYEVNVSINGQEFPVYITKDGNYFANSLVSLETVKKSSSTSSSKPSSSTTVPKTDKPLVELYIWGYCPYGVQAQGPLAQVATLLKNSANFEIVPYYDGHGPFETQQNKIQLCIQKEAKDLYWKYAAGFVKDIYPKCSSSRDVTCDKDESIKLMKSLGIDSTKIMSCVQSSGTSLFDQAAAKAQTNGVTGSPTLVINGVKANVARTAEAYKTAVCDAFTDSSKPAECSTTLDSTAATASGNC